MEKIFKFTGKAFKEEATTIDTQSLPAWPSGLWVFKINKKYNAYFHLSTSGDLLFASEMRGMNPLEKRYWIGEMDKDKSFLMVDIDCGNCRDAGTLIRGYFQGPHIIKGSMSQITFFGTKSFSLEAVKLK